MDSLNTNRALTCGLPTSFDNGKFGRSIFTEGRWLSLARALQLSGRELQIVQCIFDDHTGETMSRQLGISVHTINTHLERLYRKLRVNTRCAAIVRVFAEYVNQSLTEAVR